jgi:hypothetical protein
MQPLRRYATKKMAIVSLISMRYRICSAMSQLVFVVPESRIPAFPFAKWTRSEANERTRGQNLFAGAGGRKPETLLSDIAQPKRCNRKQQVGEQSRGSCKPMEEKLLLPLIFSAALNIRRYCRMRD